MNVLMINGSPRKNGNTAKLLQQIAESIDPTYTIEVINTIDLSFKPCTGCSRCRPDRECVMNEDDARIVGRKIMAADIFIVGSPNYLGNMTGTLKNLFDRSVTVFETRLPGRLAKPRQKGKKAVIVTTSGAPWPINLLPSQAAGTIRSIKTVLKKGGYCLVGTINYGGAPMKSELPAQIIKKAKRIGASF
ncbi:MAG TPA: flavodoxin family protein [Bacillota bacterium]|nr:flavodoxin family protein [Bacillota bacterium]